MKQFSVLQAPVMAFFSKDFYKDVAKRWKGSGFGALFLLLLILWTATCIKGYFVISQGLENKSVNQLIDQLPTMDLNSGKLSIDKPCPYTVSIPAQEGTQSIPLITFDTTGTIKSVDEANGSKALITADEFIVKKDDEVQTLPWSSIGSNFHASPKDIKEILKTFGLVFLGVFWLCGLFIFIGHMILALIYGLIGMVMDRNKLGYGTCLRMATLSMTPVMILSTALSISGLQIPFWPWLTIPICLGYLYFALSCVDNEAPITAVSQ